MARTLDMFQELKPPRARPRVLMHVSDAYSKDGKPVVRLQCTRCRRETWWIEFETVSQAKKGKPCDVCNQPAGAQSTAMKGP